MTTNQDQESESKTSVRDTVRVMRIAMRGIFRSRIPQMAAALAFRTLFAVIPILVISVAIVGAFADAKDVEDTFDRALQEFGFDTIVISDPAADPAAVPAAEPEPPQPEDAPPESAAAPESASQNSSQSSSENPGQSSSENSGQSSAEEPETQSEQSADELRLQDLLNDLIERLLAIPFGAIGAVGLLTLIYAAMSMLTEIERAFNHIYRAKAGRSWVRRITQYWTTLTLGALLIFLTFYTSVRFQGLGVGGSAVGFAVSISITALFFLLAYVTLPNTRVHVRTAAVGGLVAAVLWEAAKWGFRQYVDYSVSYAKLYGSIGILPLFMLWIYFTWVIVLFGLQVSFGLQHIGAARELAEQDEAEQTLTDPAAVIPLLVRVGDNFARGKPTPTSALADQTGIPAAIADAIIEQLAAAGYVHKLDGGDDRYTLAMPPSEIPIDRVLAEAHRLVRTSGDGDDRYAHALDRLRNAEQAALEGVTLADLLSDRARARLDARSDGDPDGPA